MKLGAEIVDTALSAIVGRAIVLIADAMLRERRIGIIAMLADTRNDVVKIGRRCLSVSPAQAAGDNAKAIGADNNLM